MTDLIATLIAIIAAIGGAFVWGNRKGKIDAKAKAAEQQAKADAAATQRAQEAQNEVDRLPDDAVTDRLRKRSGK